MCNPEPNPDSAQHLKGAHRRFAERSYVRHQSTRRPELGGKDPHRELHIVVGRRRTIAADQSTWLRRDHGDPATSSAHRDRILFAGRPGASSIVSSSAVQRPRTPLDQADRGILDRGRVSPPTGLCPPVRFVWEGRNRLVCGRMSAPRRIGRRAVLRDGREPNPIDSSQDQRPAYQTGDAACARFFVVAIERDDFDTAGRRQSCERVCKTSLSTAVIPPQPNGDIHQRVRARD